MRGLYRKSSFLVTHMNIKVGLFAGIRSIALDFKVIYVAIARSSGLKPRFSKCLD